MEEVRKEAEEEIMRGTIVRPITIGVRCAARARLRSGRATGPDRVPREMLKCLPWSTVRHIQQVFDSILRLSIEWPTAWREILIAYMPKMRDATNLSDARLLCMQNSMTPWFSACIVTLVEQHIDDNKLFPPSVCMVFGKATVHMKEHQV